MQCWVRERQRSLAISIDIPSEISVDRGQGEVSDGSVELGLGIRAHVDIGLE